MRGWTSRVTAERKAKPRLVTAAALKAGLADNEFWDGEGSVRLVTWLHLAVVVGFLAIVLGVTAKALTGTGSPHVIALWWIAVDLGGATIALGVGYVCLDVLDALTDQLRGRLPFLLVPAGLVLPAMMAFLYSAWSDPTKRRTIGVLWDVGTFWPRSYHPLSPPCYTERAVPELQRRLWWLHDNGGRVMLAAYSQGAALAIPAAGPTPASGA